MFNRFQEKGYPRHVLDTAFNFVKKTDRQGLLQKRAKDDSQDVVRVIGTFDARHQDARDEQVKQMLKVISGEICELDMSDCYWLTFPTMDIVSSCRKLVKLNMSGCSITSLRLSKILTNLHFLCSLSIDINAGFDSGQLSSECRTTLGHLRELKQTLFVPSYGVVPCCTRLEKLLLYFEVLDRTREGMLKKLRSISLPVCAITDTRTKTLYQTPGQSVPSNSAYTFGKKVRIGIPSFPKMSEEQDTFKLQSAFWKLLKEIPVLQQLELIGSNFYSVMPRNDPAIRNTYPPCKRSQTVRDEDIAAISQLSFLQSLTLAQLPGILTGSCLVSIGRSCQQLRTLSLANFGMMGKTMFMPSLCEMLTHCKYLKDLSANIFRSALQVAYFIIAVPVATVHMGTHGEKRMPSLDADCAVYLEDSKGSRAGSNVGGPGVSFPPLLAGAVRPNPGSCLAHGDPSTWPAGNKPLG
ncbi:unnamed protein product [Ranitomeya imitator]|uniref:F-box/LRR-repeat protein 18 LRR domain-containing protein n=1 Tax=Ranitomeya imitator TaxID=111125 RepID=A0ABN9LWK8_9NEOB|nr:unnamed protein product [Ranitomeya imitator]